MDVSPWLLVGASAVLCIPLALELRQMTRGGPLALIGLYLFFFLGSCSLIDRFLVDIPVAGLGKPPALVDGLETRLRKDPVCRVLAQCDPQGYQALVDCMAASGLSSMAQAYDSPEVNRILAQSLHANLPKASDSALVHYMQATLRELQETAWDRPDACLTVGMGQDAGCDRAYFIGEEMRDLYTGVFMEVLSSASRGGHPVPSRTAYNQAMKAVMEELRAGHGSELRLLKDPGRYVRDEEDRARYCRLVTSYYEAIAFQPSEEAGAILRWVCATSAVAEGGIRLSFSE
ncbi:hypothetical protein [Desulfoluna spongiiphila]|uniref:Uncharacterized protein n=1 Tax=Desulfoluna spongiiphila TaxID=419481 RepID=A0A1G5H479_9BACT|nr:hypothetical protein [Desulfoluna spongiiphila]SCY58349.1 hypothetical protein SAMN05216233_112105 [Desulfoluna spongiiphila]